MPRGAKPEEGRAKRSEKSGKARKKSTAESREFRTAIFSAASITERHHEQSCASILAALRVTDHGAGAVIDLRFFSGNGEDDSNGLGQLGSAKLANKALHRLVAAGEAVVGNQILPDGHGIASTAQSQFDGLAIRLAGTGGWILIRRPESVVPKRLSAKVGGHLVGRFCRCSPSPRTRWSHGDPNRFQVCAGCLSAHTRGLLDAPQRPSEPSQCYDLLFLLFAQDVAHADGAYKASRRSQRPGLYSWPILS